MVLCIILELEPLIRFKRGQQTTTFWIFQCKLRKCPLALWKRGSVNRKRSQTLHPIHCPITGTLLRSQTVNHVWWFVINYAVKNSRSWRAHAYIPSYQLLSDTRFQFVTLLVQLSLACLLTNHVRALLLCNTLWMALQGNHSNWKNACYQAKWAICASKWAHGCNKDVILKSVLHGLLTSFTTLSSQYESNEDWYERLLLCYGYRQSNQEYDSGLFSMLSAKKVPYLLLNRPLLIHLRWWAAHLLLTLWSEKSS